MAPMVSAVTGATAMAVGEPTVMVAIVLMAAMVRTVSMGWPVRAG